MSTIAGTSWRVPFSQALIHCRANGRAARRGSTPGSRATSSTVVVALDLVGMRSRETPAARPACSQDVAAVPLQELPQLVDAPLGAVQHLLCDGRALMRPAGSPRRSFSISGSGMQRLALHVAGRETIHCIGNRAPSTANSRLIGDRREVGRLLRVAAEQDRVAG